MRTATALDRTPQHNTESLLDLARRGIESGLHSLRESLVIVECALDLAGDSISLRCEAVAVLVELGERLLETERDDRLETPRHALASALRSAARTLPDAQSVLRLKLHRAADCARRGWLRVALHNASLALHEHGTVVPSLAARVVSVTPADSTSIESALDSDRVVVRVQMYDSASKTRRSEVFDLGLRDALKRLAVPAVGGWELRCKAALESDPAVGRMLAARERLAVQGDKLVARAGVGTKPPYNGLVPFALQRWDGGWGCQLDMAADKLRESVAAAREDTACSTLPELERACTAVSGLLASPRGGLAKRVRVLYHVLRRRNPEADLAIVRQIALKRMSDRLRVEARGSRGLRVVPGAGLTLWPTPTPARLAVLGPFDYPCGAIEQTTTVQLHLPGFQAWFWAQACQGRSAHDRHGFRRAWEKYEAAVYGRKARLAAAPCLAPRYGAPEYDDSHDAHVRRRVEYLERLAMNRAALAVDPQLSLSSL